MSAFLFGPKNLTNNKTFAYIDLQYTPNMI